MTTAQDLPLWAAILVSFFLLVGAGLTLIGSIGFLRFRTFYERLHAPTLALRIARMQRAEPTLRSAQAQRSVRRCEGRGAWV